MHAFFARLRFEVALLMIATALGCRAPSAYAQVVISSGKTQNMTCSGSVCAPTAASAVLNVGTLETMLASGNAEVTTTGSGGVQASNIVSSTALSWSTTYALTLDAYQSITVNKTISVNGMGGLTLTTDDGGTGGRLSFGRKASVVFANLSSQLTVNNSLWGNNQRFTLMNSIAALASAVAANPAGSYALAASYDASGDGTYAASPIATTATGRFEGLGNTISHLSINSKGQDYVGLFALHTGVMENLNLTSLKVVTTLDCAHESFAGGVAGDASYLVNISVTGKLTSKGPCGSTTGLLAGFADDVIGSTASGSLTSSAAAVGGLVGYGGAVDSGGTITNSSASVTVVSTNDNGEGNVGGLCGSCSPIENSYATGNVTGGAAIGGLGGSCSAPTINADAVVNSFATGVVSSGTNGLGGVMGGLCGTAGGTIDQVFATGSVTAEAASSPFGIGGLLGITGGSVISNAYATGAVTSIGAGGDVGGLVGLADGGTITITASYSIGSVSAPSAVYVGGFIGGDYTKGGISYAYWDTDTSGQSQGAGNITNDPGITGLTTSQFQSGLPSGFSSSIWGEASNVNGGFPYLLALPPP